MCLSIAVERPDCVLASGEHADHEWMVVHNGHGQRCGYVKVGRGHPWFGKDWNDDVADRIRVHGGVTFGEPDVDCGKGGPDDGYWVGFDCAHFGDGVDVSLPIEDAYREMYDRNPDLFYRGEARSQEYVEAECRDLCEQAKVAAKDS